MEPICKSLEIFKALQLKQLQVCSFCAKQEKLEKMKQIVFYFAGNKFYQDFSN